MVPEQASRAFRNYTAVCKLTPVWVFVDTHIVFEILNKVWDSDATTGLLSVALSGCQECQMYLT